MTDTEEKEQTPQTTSIDELKALLETEQQARTAAEAEIAKREAALIEVNAASVATRKSLLDTVNAYKSVVIQANPSIPAELISGDTFQAIDSSLESGKILVSKVKLSVEAEIASGKVPAGAPPRTAPDIENLTPREKIKYAISKGGKN